MLHREALTGRAGRSVVVLLVVAAVSALGAVLLLRSRPAPLPPLAVSGAPSAGTATVDARTTDASCAALSRQLPRRLDTLRSRPTEPVSARLAAWGEPAVVLRCGTERPAGFRLGVEPLTVDDVAWFQRIAGEVVVWTTVDRRVPVELTIPAVYGGQGALLVAVAPAIKAVLPAVAIEPGPL